MNKRINIAIDARLPDSAAGGVQQVICTLALGFSDITDQNIFRFWFVYKDSIWWKAYIPANDTVIELKSPFGTFGNWFAKRNPSIVSKLMPLVSKLVIRSKFPLDNYYRSLNIDLVHLPFQDAAETSFPSIYHPHDLQHVYFPDFFSNSQIRHRDLKWKNRAIKAAIVIAETSLVKEDLSAIWGIPNKKIIVLPSPPLARKDIEVPLNLKFSKYIFYPAAFWPHKNHRNLLLAVKILIEQGTDVNLVLSGSKVGQFIQIKKMISELNLEEHVSILGHIDDHYFQTVLQNASVMVVPTLFESLSLPIWEAQIAGIPVVCSNIGSLPIQVGSSALLFDPLNPEDIAECVKKVLNIESIREKLIDVGHSRTLNLTSRNFSLAFNGIYKNLCGFHETNEEANALVMLRESVDK